MRKLGLVLLLGVALASCKSAAIATNGGQEKSETVEKKAEEEVVKPAPAVQLQRVDPQKQAVKRPAQGVK